MIALPLPLLAAAALAPGPVASDLPGLFVGACMDGSVSLSGWRGKKVAYGVLPARLRDSLGTPSSSKVYQLDGDAGSYLYVLEYASGGRSPAKVCGLASKDLSRTVAADAMGTRIEGASRGRRAGEIGQWYRPQDGYVAIATREAGYTVLQVTWLTDEQKERALAAMRPIGGTH